MKKELLFAFASFFFMSLSAITGVYAVEESDNMSIISKDEVDVTGDGKKDIVFLKGVVLEGEEDIYERLFIEVATKSKSIKIKLEDGSTPKISFADLNHDGILDLFVSTPAGGSTMYTKYNLFTLEGHKVNELDLPEPLTITSRFKNEYKAEMSIQANGNFFEYDLKDRQKNYDRIGFYQNGKLNEPTELIIDPYGDFRIVNFMGVSGLKGSQTVSGAYLTDNIATIHSTWVYEKGTWKLVHTSVFQTENKNK